ncbi:MAG: hypothetical protein CMJ78_01885 [Planctomycetaceae bacterium]|nr:hypothetical protein [Planctomycetaceae bacterium]
MMISLHMRSDGRFADHRVETLEAACNHLRNSEQTDVVVLDLHLPDSMGLETFTSLHRQFPEVPIVILSGQEDELFAVEALAQGAQDYVPKGTVDERVLVRSLLYAIERNGRQLAERRTW